MYSELIDKIMAAISNNTHIIFNDKGDTVVYLYFHPSLCGCYDYKYIDLSDPTGVYEDSINIGDADGIRRLLLWKFVKKESITIL